jgi:isoamylase
VAQNASLTVTAGQPWPFGAHPCCDGTNFAVFSRHATQMELWLFEGPAARMPSAHIALDPKRHRTGDIWHAHVGADLVGQCYVFRALGPLTSDARHRFDPQSLLLDPYAALVAPWPVRRAAAEPDGADSFNRRFAGIVARERFDWQGVRSPHHAWHDTILYETHVRGLTVHPSSGAHHPGQYLGVIEKIPYLRSLGITAVELLPVQAFDGGDVSSRSGPSPLRVDYWGYNPIALFAPHSAYASGQAIDSPLTQFKTMVRELHRAGIEVILDVVFNHTGEGGPDGPLYSFRGLDNDIYYLLTREGSGYLDYTGCGNTLNCNHPVVRAMIVDCLRHWVVHMHVDGFRFDLAAVLGRGTDGALLSNPPVLEEIAEDPILREVKLIAEAWDSGGAFEVGHFPGTRWGEWNCHFRDDVRRFWRGDAGFTGHLATRICGSPDLYERGGQTPVKSINLITSHDGFTLMDLVSYAGKHNESNGEQNRDGLNENYSANYGAEGPTTDPAMQELRLRQVKNLLATLLLARGIPMILGGDEFGRTQLGNNNAYCQDNELSWYDWTLTDQHSGLVRFLQRLIALRMSHAALRAEHFYTAKEIEWLGPYGNPPEWHGLHNRLGCLVRGDGALLAMLFNAATELCEFRLSTPEEQMWRVCIDTARAPPDDAPDETSAPRIRGLPGVPVAARSVRVLVLEASDSSAR